MCINYNGNPLPENIIHPKDFKKDYKWSDDDNLSFDDYAHNVRLLKLTDEMGKAIKETVLPRLKSEYNITTFEQFKGEDEIDMLWCCSGAFDGGWDFHFGLNQNDYLDNDDFIQAKENAFMHYFEQEEGQILVNKVYDYMDDFLD